jgi:hypothetical protein
LRVPSEKPEVAGLKAAAAPAWLKLAPDIHVVRETDGWALISERGALRIEGDTDLVGAILSPLAKGAWLPELMALSSPPILGRILLELFERQWLMGEQDGDVDARFRQVTGWLGSLTPAPVSALGAMDRATVLIIGLGGLGCEIAQHLAGSGVGGFVLVDGDSVDLSNLNRQYMYDHASVGRPKVHVAAESITARSPLARVRPLPIFLRSAEDLARLDCHQFQLVLNCADQPRGIDGLVAAYCERRGVPFVTAGVGLHRGYWGPFLTARHMRALEACEARLRASLGSTVAAWDRARVCTSSHGPYNSIVAAHVATDAIFFLSGVAEPKSLRKRLFVDFDTLKVAVICAEVSASLRLEGTQDD